MQESDFQNLLENPLGKLYFDALLALNPNVKDPTEIYLRNNLTVAFFIKSIQKKHGENCSGVFDRIARRVKSLSCPNLISDKNENRERWNTKIAELLNVIFTLPGMLESERFRKGELQKVFTKEDNAYQKKKRQVRQRYQRAIKIIKELDPKFNINKYSKLAKEKANALKPNTTLLQLREIHRHGLIWAFPKERRSTKGSEVLSHFIYRVHSVVSLDSTRTPNNICTHIGAILDLMEPGKKHSRKNIAGILSRANSLFKV